MLRIPKKREKKAADKAQVILEFTFCMIVVLLMIFGVTKVFFWTGATFAGISRAHDSTLVADVEPLQQIDSYFYTPIKMNAIWNGT